MTAAIEAKTGRMLWEREAHKGLPPQPRHPRNSYASETPICDGERLYVYFADIGMYCYDLDGKPLWDKRLEHYPVRGGWGTGTSPVLHKGRLFLVNDNEKESFMIALDAKTGKDVWHVKSPEPVTHANGYSMTGAPLIVNGMVITGVAGAEFSHRGLLEAYDAKTGKHLWRTYTIPAKGEPGSEGW